MIVVSIDLVSAIDGHVERLGQMTLCNDGTGTNERGNYEVRLARRGAKSVKAGFDKPQKIARVENYPRLSITIWHLVARALSALQIK